MSSVRMLLAQAEPAGGAPTEDLIPAVIVAVVASAVLGGVAWAERSGQIRVLDWIGRTIARLPPTRGLPPWAALPIGLTTVSLLTAVFGFYWDVSTHIDNGRDAGPFANPSHFFILAGLGGIAVAGFFAVMMGSGEQRRSVRVAPGWHAPIGGVLLLACGVIALAGFPLDDVWHRIFGQDVTLWGPTHIQMVAGASLSTLAMWVLQLEGEQSRTGQEHPPARWGVELPMAAAFLVGLATLQAEFDFGVPQFRLLYQPILLALAAGIGLVAARIRLGRGAALGAAVGFIVIRGALLLLVGPLLGRTEPHFPLFLAEAVLVELVALAVSRERPVAFGAAAGLAVGTVGFAAEWAWSHVWMPNPWQPSMLAEALVWATLAGLAGGVIGGLVGRALTGGAVAARPAPKWAGALAGLTAIVALGWALPTNGGGGASADVALRDLSSDPRTVEATITLDPADAADGAQWLTVTAWQGADWKRQDVVIDRLDEVSPGVYRSTEPIPVDGEWKALLRLHNGRTLAALPLFMPEDKGIPAEEISARASFRRDFVPDKEVLQREFTGGAAWLEGVAYTLLAAIAVGWIAIMAWGLNRLLGDRDDSRARPSAPATGRVRVDRVGTPVARS